MPNTMVDIAPLPFSQIPATPNAEKLLTPLAPTPTSHEQAPTIRPYHAPRHISIIQNRQITLRHILRLPRAPRRTLLPHLQHHLLPVLVAHFPQCRVDHARTNAVDL
jgi:hypothetical protein